MKSFFKGPIVLQPALIVAMLFFTIFQSRGQQLKPATSGYAPVNGIKVYYEVYGQGMPIVLLHGAFHTIDLNWSQLIPELSKERKVIALEMQGHGHSPYSDREMSIPALASDVERVMDFLGIDSADVAGYSMGGTVAYQFAIQSPKRLRKLVIISSTYKSEGWLPIGNEAFEDFSPELFEGSPLKTAYYAAAPDTTQWRKFLDKMIDQAQKPFNCGDTNIARITSPVMIISGDNDGVDKVELMKTYRLLGGDVHADMEPMPRSRLAIVPSQGHVSIMMQTETILGYLKEFLN